MCYKSGNGSFYRLRLYLTSIFLLLVIVSATALTMSACSLDEPVGKSPVEKVDDHANRVVLFISIYKMKKSGKGRIINMGRVSVKEDKSLYQIRREELGLSREKAEEILESIPAERIEKIENKKSLAHPDEILTMADGYKMPVLCNYYCANECPIGKKYVPEIKIKDLSQIVLEILSSLNSMEKESERFIEIAADGMIEGEEIKDFINIQEKLEKISITVETLQLWAENMLVNKKIDVETYNLYKNQKQ